MLGSDRHANPAARSAHGVDPVEVVVLALVVVVPSVRVDVVVGASWGPLVGVTVGPAVEVVVACERFGNDVVVVVVAFGGLCMRAAVVLVTAAACVVGTVPPTTGALALATGPTGGSLDGGEPPSRTARTESSEPSMPSAHTPIPRRFELETSCSLRASVFALSKKT